jgi:hypothetical protein
MSQGLDLIIVDDDPVDIYVVSDMTYLLEKPVRLYALHLAVKAIVSKYIKFAKKFRLRMKGLTRIAVTETKHVSTGMDRRPLQSAAAGNTPVMDALPVHHLFQFLIPKKVLPQEIFSDAALEPALTPQKGHHLKTG